MAVGWVVIAILVLVGMVLLEFKDIKHRVFLVVVVAGLLFLTVSVGSVYFNNDLDLTSFKGLSEATGVYIAWVANFFGNLGDLSGYAIEQQWNVNGTSRGGG
jgi:hypothetical protein